MLDLLGRGVATTCNGTTRRDFLKVGALGAMGFTLADYLAAKAAGGVAATHDERSVIMIFNLGAPSQLDTFDMKPEAAAFSFRPSAITSATRPRSPRRSATNRAVDCEMPKSAGRKTSEATLIASANTP